MGRGASQDGSGLLTPSFDVKKGAVFVGKIKKKEKDLALALRKVLLESPDLLKIRYRWSEHPMYGHCYVATEALYHLLGGKQEGWSGYVYGFEDDFDWEPGENTHWWLQNEDGRIVDCTADQFGGVSFPYAKGRKAAFVSSSKEGAKKPSKRAAEAIKRLEKSLVS